MKIVRKEDRKLHKNSDLCLAYEYPWENKDINGAVIDIKGRYPEKGFVVNKVCTEIVLVLEGSGILGLGSESINFTKEDMILIEPNEKYYFDGDCKILAACSPSWYPEQHIELE